VPLLSVAFVDDTLCYAGYDQNGSGFGVLRSSDAGITWSEEVNMATFFYPVYYGILPMNNGSTYVGAKPSWDDTGIIFKRHQSGDWSYDVVNQPIYELSSYADSVVFAVGDSGYIVTNVPPSQLSVDHFTKVPNEMNVFPNPVSETIYLSGTIEPESTFTICSTDGKLVLSGTVSPAKTIDCRLLMTGTYLLTVQSGTKIQSTRIVRD
jgi:hypothetical protein